MRRRRRAGLVGVGGGTPPLLKPSSPYTGLDLPPCRRRGVLRDPLLPRMQPAASPEAVQQAASLCAEMLAGQRAALEAGAYEPPPGRRVAGTRDTPLCIRGVALVRGEQSSRALQVAASRLPPAVRHGCWEGGGMPVGSLPPASLLTTLARFCPPASPRQDAFIDGELSALAHQMAKQQLLDGDGGCACVQVVALGAPATCRPQAAGPRLVESAPGRLGFEPETQQQPGCLAGNPAPFPPARALPSRLRLRHPPLAPAAAAMRLV